MEVTTGSSGKREPPRPPPFPPNVIDTNIWTGLPLAFKKLVLKLKCEADCVHEVEAAEVKNLEVQQELTRKLEESENKLKNCETELTNVKAEMEGAKEEADKWQKMALKLKAFINGVEKLFDTYPCAELEIDDADVSDGVLTALGNNLKSLLLTAEQHKKQLANDEKLKISLTYRLEELKDKLERSAETTLKLEEELENAQIRFKESEDAKEEAVKELDQAKENIEDSNKATERWQQMALKFKTFIDGVDDAVSNKYQRSKLAAKIDIPTDILNDLLETLKKLLETGEHNKKLLDENYAEARNLLANFWSRKKVVTGGCKSSRTPPPPKPPNTCSVSEGRSLELESSVNPTSQDPTFVGNMEDVNAGGMQVASGSETVSTTKVLSYRSTTQRRSICKRPNSQNSKRVSRPRNLTGLQNSSKTSISNATRILRRRPNQAIIRKEFECSKCSLSFPSFPYLKRHMVSDHEDTSTLRGMKTACKFCDFKCRSIVELNAHKKDKHLWNKPGRKATKKKLPQPDLASSVTQGLHQVDTSDPSKCRCTCGRKLCAPSKLLRHIETCLLGSIFGCIFCQVQNTEYDKIKKHMREKHGDKKDAERSVSVRCALCENGKIFSSKEEIIEHGYREHAESK